MHVEEKHTLSVSARTHEIRQRCGKLCRYPGVYLDVIAVASGISGEIY